MPRAIPSAMILAIGIACRAIASISVSVDKLDPSDGIPMPPNHLVIVDVFVHATADSGWGGAAIVGQPAPSSGAFLHYALRPSGAITPHPSGNRFVTFISLPRERDADERFDPSSQATVFGPAMGGATPVWHPTQLNVAYGYPPPPPDPLPAVDGYVARIVLDLTNVTNPLFQQDSANIVFSETPPADSVRLLEAWTLVAGNPDESDEIVWGIYGIIPEPATGALALLAAATLLRRR